MLLRHSLLRSSRPRPIPFGALLGKQQLRSVETAVWKPPKFRIDARAVRQEESWNSGYRMTEGKSRGPKRPYRDNGDSKFYQGPGRKKQKKEKSNVFEGTAEQVLEKDIELVKERDVVPRPEGETAPELPEKFSTVNVTITHLGSGGDGLGVTAAKDRVYLVPFSLPGDEVEAKIVFHDKDHSRCDFIKVIKPSPQRDDKRIGCGYFSVCGGCQFQMMSYEDQLAFKREQIQRAYKNFSGIAPEIMPEIGTIIPSPKQYGYRTKLSPHFDGPIRGGWREGQRPVIGFMMKGRRQNVEIEDCPIGTDVLRKAIPTEKEYVFNNLNKVYKRGATLLLRESTERTPDEKGDVEVENADGTLSKYLEKKLCLTDQKAMTTEYVGRFKLNFLAGDFFQNNNSILKDFTDFVKSKLHLPVPGSDAADSAPKYLVDAYCGSGLFSITCGEHFAGVVGVDISPESIRFAEINANNNGIKNTKFIAGKAERIFEDIKFPPAETSVIIDPSRKGCDELFLNQLLDFSPKRIVYISCNVHTQARDLGYFLNDERGKGYKIDLIRGFDLFPQTYHVEGCAVLTKI